MKKNLIVLALIIVCISASYGQSKDNSITIVNSFFGTQFYQHDKKLKMAEIVKIMETNEQAYKNIKSARTNNTLATIVGGVGGFMVGYPIGTSGSGGNPNWTMAGIGAGLIAVSIPLSIIAKSKTKKAVDIYNSNANGTSYMNKTEVNFSFTGNAIGVTLIF